MIMCKRTQVIAQLLTEMEDLFNDVTDNKLDVERTTNLVTEAYGYIDILSNNVQYSSDEDLSSDAGNMLFIFAMLSFNSDLEHLENTVRVLINETKIKIADGL